MDPLLSLLLVLALGFAFGELAALSRLPRVLGYILGGFVLGAMVAEVSPLIDFLSDVGLVFLFFFIGLEIKLSVFKKEFGASGKLSAWVLALTFLTGFLFGYLVFDSVLIASAIGICASVSAQAVCISLLAETKLLKKREGALLIEAGVITDVIQLIAVTLLFSALPSVGGFTYLSLVINWAAVFAALILAKLILFPLLHWTVQRGRDARMTFFFGSVILAVLMGYLTEQLGGSSILGALFAGIAIREFFDDRIATPLTSSFRLIGFGFLVPVLFVWTGYEVYNLGVFDAIALGAGLAILIIIAAQVGARLALPRARMRTRVLAGLGLATTGDIEIVLASILLHAQAITPYVFSTIIAMSITTMIIAPALFYSVGRR